MAEQSTYVPPKVWTPPASSGGTFASINRPVAGPTHDKELPVGRHPFQLYSLATPNGVKVTIMLEELLAAGHSGAEYDAWLIRINEGTQFASGFVEVNPNSKIPALLDRQLAAHRFVAGDEYTIADMAIWPWYGGLVLGQLYDAAEFLSVHEYQHVKRWADEIAARPAVIRGRKVNRSFGPEQDQVHERHSAADLD
jgi:glutathione S-transferase